MLFLRELPYGQIVVNNGSKYGFTGKEKDATSGMHYFSARYYDSDTGRFVSADPAKDGINNYAYVANNPMNYVDPTGLEMYLSENAEDEKCVIDDLNSFFGEDVFEYNEENLVEPTGTYSSGTDDQKLLYGIIMDVITSSERITIKYFNTVPENSYFIIDDKEVIIGKDESEISHPLGLYNSDISFDSGTALIHELGHARAYLLTPDRSNGFTYGETIAVCAENVARRISGKEERIYYSYFYTFEYNQNRYLSNSPPKNGVDFLNVMKVIEGDFKTKNFVTESEFINILDDANVKYDTFLVTPRQYDKGGILKIIILDIKFKVKISQHFLFYQEDIFQ